MSRRRRDKKKYGMWRKNNFRLAAQEVLVYNETIQNMAIMLNTTEKLQEFLDAHSKRRAVHGPIMFKEKK